MNEHGHCGYREELQRIKHVSDMLASGYSVLRDRASHKALLLDMAVLGASVWLTALAFVDPQIESVLTPANVVPKIWIGILGVVTFVLSLVQLKVDWKGKAEAYSRACRLYSSIKMESGYVLSNDSQISSEAAARLLERYSSAGEICVPLPECQFLKIKRLHKTKVAISKYLDKYPNASIVLLKIRMWWRDNTANKDLIG